MAPRTEQQVQNLKIIGGAVVALIGLLLVIVGRGAFGWPILAFGVVFAAVTVLAGRRATPSAKGSPRP